MVEAAAALPVDEALPGLMAALAAGPSAVVVAPPGAGKTTRVPLALLSAPWRGDGKILVLEPRRLAARGAAARMAQTLGESVGETVGLRVRLGSKVSARTRIEVVTDGVFARMIVDDPELAGVAAVLFDEFHERSLDADLGLALALDAQSGLREDLRVLVMSATLDGARVARLLGPSAQVIESQGRAFPVETRHLPRDPRARVEDATASAIRRALAEETGSVLAFLPGRAEIRRTAERLEGLAGSVEVVELHGGLDPRQQDRAVAPAEPGARKVVLATSIAETSLTIQGVRIVVDCGLARVPRHEASLGITRLETARASRAAVDQRRGRAGRTEPGVCYRLWEEAATASLPPFAEPEILASDLGSFLLDLAAWGVSDPATLAFLDPPPASALAEARASLASLGALDADGRLTERGEKIRSIALPPRLAGMLLDAVPEGDGPLAAAVALLAVERGLGGDGPDLGRRLDRFLRERGPRAEDARRLSETWLRAAGGKPGAIDVSRAGLVAAKGFPDRIAKARGGRPGQFLLANGRGAALDETEALAREPFLAVLDLTGVAQQGRILLAAALTEAEAVEAAGDGVQSREEVEFDEAVAAVRGRARRKLGAITLGERPLTVKPSPETAAALAEGLARRGIDRLPWSDAARALRARVGFLANAEPDGGWPDLSDEALSANAAEWLAPFIGDATALRDVGADDLGNALSALVPYDLRRRLDAEAPSHFEAPTGSTVPIDYAGEDAPAIEIRVQELFGLARHPSIAGGRLPLTLRLTSPARRPIQVTRDLPGFWAGSWRDVRAEMRGRYPRHPWPEDPANAAPTTRAKPRGT
ncbi:ATP-dependent helicase HrpB [Chenggangzhangella methanolivorans]|uniref:ATP-dependent helicase HrpB n=1 Tax=Chenggangzhangella methanolivorans TaxID=1437009 RepID=A0A9E6ULL0_9HYPH|nr:ATP-dependent helicase HrpB [Chenggangzhangella methanolivorans]QZN98323.1 ATP-dependent helicase HrpB [Chenggangzhangella methanolivorans]